MYGGPEILRRFIYVEISLVSICLLLTITVQAQEKGIKAITPQQNPTSAKSFALVIGISDYQDPFIPDLQYADIDARVFADYLQSPAGGPLEDSQLKILINEQATAAQIATALDWLLEVAHENDRVIIYFSGHGDVERKTISQPGYLLCWDAPASVYLAGGTLALPMFQDIIATISLQNKAKVTVIMDACHSGKLSGSNIAGSAITGANLAKQYANEVKILSAQPDEFSIEGEQWGGGRGVFSYHLVNALYGMADQNNDQLISLQEIGRYLEDHVTTEVAPIKQIPMIIGNRAEIIAEVDKILLTALKDGKNRQLPSMTSLDSKGLEDEVLVFVDSVIVKKYNLFKIALKEKQFLQPAGQCAETYYSQLMAEEKLKLLHSTMRRNYAAALQDDAQQVLNKILSGDIKEHALSSVQASQKYKPYIQQLERASELLGSTHYMYSILQARKCFFEAYLLTQTSSWQPNKENSNRALALFRKALHWQPELPHAYLGIAYLYGSNYLNADSAAYYTQKAVELAPAWNLPYINFAYLLSEKMKDFSKATEYIQKARDLDSNSIILLNTEGVFYYRQKQYLKSAEIFEKAIQKDSTITALFVNLGNAYADSARLDEAEVTYFKAIQMDSTMVETYNNLGGVYLAKKQYPLAEKYYLKTLQLDSTQAVPYYNLACIHSKQSNMDKAFVYLEQALHNGLNLYEYIQQDKDLEEMRKYSKRWNSLLKIYFPDKFR